MNVAIIGLYNSGSSVLAQIVDTFGFHLGPPFWHDHFESASLRSQLVRWWSEPQLVETVPQLDRVTFLKTWLQEQKSFSWRVCAKHPLLCLSAVDLPLAWGAGVKYIRADRDLEESIAGLDARGWFKSHSEPSPARRIQTTLWTSANTFFSQQFHLRIDYNQLVKNPEYEISRMIKYLEILPTDEQTANAAALVRRSG